MIVITVLLLLILSTAVWMYILSVYEIKYTVNESINRGNYKLVMITTIPINAFGKRALFRNINSTFEIIGGKKSVLSNCAQDNRFVLKISKNTFENILVKASCGLSFFPAIIEINPKLK